MSFIEQSFKDVKFFVRIPRQYILFVQCSDTEVFFISHSDGDIWCLPVIAMSFRHCWPLHRPEDVRNSTISNYIYSIACYQDHTIRIYCTKNCSTKKKHIKTYAVVYSYLPGTYSARGEYRANLMRSL